MQREHILKWLQHRALQAAPYEACGFILNDGQIIEVANVAQNPMAYFEMDGQDVAKRVTLEQISRISAVWHTHPNGSTVPSHTDIEAMKCGAVQSHWLYFIATPSAVTQWEPKDYAPQDNSFWNAFTVTDANWTHKS